ncbi:TPA: glycosyltransferase [archaeon]|nr:glycosyltransferase [Candidatus Naiadarchaeales archaeon SRR2090153.bin461]HIK02606.1 glycosyltransferase [Candidatus Naiadarchaeales archaeon SRR2090159.bin1288]
MAKLKAILGPYPPPFRGVEMQSKLEFEQLRGKALFLGTSDSPFNGKNICLVKRGPFAVNGPQLLLKIFLHRNEISEISAHYATTFGFLAAVAKKLFGIPYTVTCHGSDVNLNMKRLFFRIFNNIALKNADKIFVVSKDLGAELIERGYNHKKIIHKPNQIDKKVFKKLNVKKKNQILCAGAIQYTKGTDLLVDAFIQIAPQLPNYSLLLVGKAAENSFANDLRSKIHSAGLQKRIHFAGEKTPAELAKIMNESKLFVMPSRSEGYGMALAEALACGLKAVATNVGGLKEAGKSKNCIFVNPNSEEISRAILNQLKYFS